MTAVLNPEIRSAFLDYRSRYEEPALEGWNPGRVSQFLLKALAPWGASLDSLSINQSTTRASELKATVDLSLHQTIAHVGAGDVQQMRNNPTWTQRQETEDIAQAALDAARETLSISFQQHEASIAMHVSVQGEAPYGLIGQFLRRDASIVSDPAVLSYGISLYREDGYVVIDTSQLYRDALFIRIARVSGGKSSLNELASALRDDEVRLAGALGISLE